MPEKKGTERNIQAYNTVHYWGAIADSPAKFDSRYGWVYCTHRGARCAPRLEGMIVKGG